MELLFYSHAVIAILAIGMAMVIPNTIHALLYAVFSLLALAVALYSMLAPLAAALEIIVYAGAIMVLFVFAVMLLQSPPLEKDKLSFKRADLLLGIAVSLVFFFDLVLVLPASELLHQSELSVKEIAIALFLNHGFLVELISFVLLAGLICVVFVGESFMNRSKKMRS